VIDAKYKGLDEQKRIYREDMFQVIAYMYALKATVGGVTYPSRETDAFAEACTLMDYG